VVTVFLGTHSPRLDDKNRVILPARYRDHLADGLVMSKGQDRCVVVWTKAGFAQYSEELAQGKHTVADMRRYSRVLFASAYDDVPDKQGRITIPSQLREYAGLTRECVVVGADTRIEIWDSAAWESYLADTEQSFVELDREVVPPGTTS
jgi:MraZ protein